jgi:hypothetical protein
MPVPMMVFVLMSGVCSLRDPDATRHLVGVEMAGRVRYCG